MWHHCTVCSADLGENSEVEHFPVSERIAYDPERGRLWAICHRCDRWNLSPLEDRWEALEELEKLWERIAVRVTSESMALGRTLGGMWIVRVGRDGGGSEFAFWRWGRDGKWLSKKRQPLHWGWWAGGAAGVGLTAMAPIAAPILGAVALKAYFALSTTEQFSTALVIDEDGRPDRIEKGELRNLGLTARDDDLGWSIQTQRMMDATGRAVNSWQDPDYHTFGYVEYTGSAAVQIARRALPIVNRKRSSDRLIRDALTAIGEAPSASAFLPHVAAQKPRWVSLKYYPEPVRLGIEMALFQQRERAAMEGELERLEAEWEEAERLAAISDSLLPPEGWEEFKGRYSAAE